MIRPQLQFLLITFAGWMNRNQQDVIEYLRMENQVLREHTDGRPGQPRRRVGLSFGTARRLAPLFRTVIGTGLRS
ncbi:MAG: hypothetical protein ACI9OJ_005354 [Myxococcota bacterium]|jgi:hypothetical protein